MRSRISGTGSSFPERRLSNADLAKLVDTNDEWIQTRTGIQERRISQAGNEEETNSSLGTRAALAALKMAGKTPADIDLIIYATCTPDTPVPGASSWLQRKLEAWNAAAFDLNAACGGFIYALTTADQFIQTGFAKTVLVVGADVLSSFTNWEDRNTCILFGDGAGAAVLEASAAEGPGLLRSVLGADARFIELFDVQAGGSKLEVTAETIATRQHKASMKGKEMYKEATRYMCKASEDVIAAEGVNPSEIKWVLAHQANLRIVEAVAKRLEVSMDRVLVNIDRYGNTSAATLPTLLDENVRNGKIQKGDLLLLVALGAGLSYGATLVRW